MNITNFEDFKKANGELVKHPVSMKTNSGGTMDVLIAGVGAKARDMMQAQRMAMLDKEALANGKGKLKDDLSSLRGNSTICVSLGLIDESGKRYMDSKEAREYLDNSVLPAELDRVSDLIEDLSGLKSNNQESAEKN